MWCDHGHIIRQRVMSGVEIDRRSGGFGQGIEHFVDRNGMFLELRKET